MINGILNNSVVGMNNVVGVGNVIGGNKSIIPQKPKQPEKKTDEHTKIVTFCADNTGCAHYRMIWPNYVLNSCKKYLVSSLMRPVLDEGWYQGLDTIRFQRQVSTSQYNVFKRIRHICDKLGVRIIYELDDIPLYEDIPLYNKNRSSYARSDYRDNILNMMNMSDEVSVSTNFMKEYFKGKIQNPNITHVPNHIPRFWLDRYYDEDRLKINFSKNKKKPRILYAGSASHYAIGSNVEDDFTKLVDYVKKTVKDYQWVFFGGMPREIIPLWREGKIEFHDYKPVANYTDVFDQIKANITIAPLLKNNFNRAKSHIKLTESAAFGIPCICEKNIEPYDEAIYTFSNASELDDQIKLLTRDSTSYMKACRKSRNIVESHWLEDNIDMWDELYKYPFGDPKRLNLNKINNV